MAAGAAGSVLLAQADVWLGIALGFVVGHFFLFCNVFRVPRPLELAWAALFVLLAGGTLASGDPGWETTFALSLAATLLVIVAPRVVRLRA